jgi:hypothetical protein
LVRNGVKRVYFEQDINWTLLREQYILGKRKQLEDGTWISEDYTYNQIAKDYGIALQTIKNKGSQESWSKLRKAYLARVNNLNIGQQLSLYTTANYQAEIAAMNACNKLGVVLDRYIENKFGDILDSSEDINSTGRENNISHVNMQELKDAIKTASDIYQLQRKIYDNAPDTDQEILDLLNTKPKYKSAQEREAAIHRIAAKLGKSVTELGLATEKKDVTNIDTSNIEVINDIDIKPI